MFSRLLVILSMIVALVVTTACSPPGNEVEEVRTPSSGDSGVPEWEKLKAAGRTEGKVVVAGPGFPALRNAVTQAFQATHGINVEYVGMDAGQLLAQIEQESQVGRITIDVFIGGNNTLWVLAERNQLDDVQPLLVDPAVVEPSVWRGGQIRLVDPSPDTPNQQMKLGLQAAEYVMTDLFVNPEIVDPAEITSWKDLLQSKYKGRIASHDPRNPGPAFSTIGYLNRLFGPDYLEDLYVGQEIALSKDVRQVAEWVARGTYPIGIALYQAGIEPLTAAGLPLRRVHPADGPGVLTGGFGSVARIANGPHPSAAAVFVNWWGSAEAQRIYEKATNEMSLRADITHEVPEYVMPQEGTNYPYNAYLPEQHYEFTQPAWLLLREKLGQ